MGRLAVATTRPVPLEELAAPPAVRRHAAGEACTPIVVGFPVGPLPNVQTATERALAGAHASVLSDVVVSYRMWYVPLVGGRVCYVAEGEAW